jgi:hypothetical protein
MLEDILELSKLGFQQAGSFLLENNELSLHLHQHKNDKGSYVFVVNGTVMYVGVTKNSLYARMNGYKNPGPSQETNKRVKPELTGAGSTSIYFLPESEISKLATVIRGNDWERQLPTDIETFERFLISMFKPIWNRA